MTHFAKRVIDSGGIVKPLIIDSQLTNGTGLFNPSVFIEDGRIFVNVRHCQYTLYHAELNKYEHPFGPLLYLNPENDISLTTTNYFGELDENLDFVYYNKVDTSAFDQQPLWEFIGLEDCRIVKWNGKMYLSGVRRDTTTHGEGRMELSEVEYSFGHVKEVSRFRIPAPGMNNSYCEKNWMPILDQPYHYLKWCNPVEIVKTDPVEKTTTTVYLGNEYFFNRDQRGGGQVIPFEDGYLCLIHETYLYRSEQDRKNATYRHKFIYWSKDWKPIATSEVFSFMEAKIEFACGLASYKDDIYVTFGFQDNSAYIAKCPKNVIKDMLNV